MIAPVINLTSAYIPHIFCCLRGCLDLESHILTSAATIIGYDFNLRVNANINIEEPARPLEFLCYFLSEEELSSVTYSFTS